MSDICSKAPLKTLGRGLQALVHLAHQPEGYTNTEMAATLRVDRASSLRILRTLRFCGFAYEENGRYRLSYKLFGLLAEMHDQISETARPVLRQLVEKTGYTASLAVWEGEHVVPVAIEKGAAPLIVNSNLGAPVPLHASALGKAMLAFKGKNEVDLLQNLKLYGFTPNTITSLQELRKELNAIKQRGYALDREEYLPGVRCIAFPVFDDNQRCIAAVSLSYPATTETTSLVFEKQVVQEVRAAANKLSQRLGTQKEVIKGA